MAEYNRDHFQPPYPDRPVNASPPPPTPRAFELVFQDSPAVVTVDARSIQITDSGALIIILPNEKIIAYADGVWRDVVEI